MRKLLAYASALSAVIFASNEALGAFSQVSPIIRADRPAVPRAQRHKARHARGRRALHRNLQHVCKRTRRRLRRARRVA